MSEQTKEVKIMANVSVFVTFRNLVHFPWKLQTTYFSVEVSVPKSLVTKKNWDAIIERASEEFFNSAPMEGVSSHRYGTHHRHRSIDEIRCIENCVLSFNENLEMLNEQD